MSLFFVLIFSGVVCYFFEKTWWFFTVQAWREVKFWWGLYNKSFIFSEKFCNIISENTFRLLYNIYWNSWIWSLSCRTWSTDLTAKYFKRIETPSQKKTLYFFDYIENLLIN